MNVVYLVVTVFQMVLVTVMVTLKIVLVNAVAQQLKMNAAYVVVMDQVVIDSTPSLSNNQLCPPYLDCGDGPITSEEEQDTSECENKV